MIWKNPVKAKVFNDLIGKLKEINTNYENAGSSVSEENEKEWNEVLCKIIILASFTKMNQA